MDAKSRTDATIGALAAASHGVVTRQQLLRAEITRDEIRRRVARGTLLRVHRGVFRVGHAAPSVLARYAAAVLACGDGAALARFAGAHLHRLRKDPPSVIDVMTPTERTVAGIRTTRSRALGEEEITVVRGIRVTTVPRTLVDLAPLVPTGDLTRLHHEARIRYRTQPREVETVLQKHPKSPGVAKLRRVILGEEKVKLSPLETAFIDLLIAEGLPLPETNVPVGGRYVDCRWPEHRLTVELDSFTFHNSRHSWEQDRLREREAYARGDEFRRYTFNDVTRTPGPMLRELRGLLS